MTDNLSDQVAQDTISEQKMQFRVIHRYPSDPAPGRDTVKAEIEQQLFVVFYGYAQLD